MTKNSSLAIASLDPHDIRSRLDRGDKATRALVVQDIRQAGLGPVLRHLGEIAPETMPAGSVELAQQRASSTAEQVLELAGNDAETRRVLADPSQVSPRQLFAWLDRRPLTHMLWQLAPLSVLLAVLLEHAQDSAFDRTQEPLSEGASNDVFPSLALDDDEDDDADGESLSFTDDALDEDSPVGRAPASLEVITFISRLRADLHQLFRVPPLLRMDEDELRALKPPSEDGDAQVPGVPAHCLELVVACLDVGEDPHSDLMEELYERFGSLKAKQIDEWKYVILGEEESLPPVGTEPSPDRVDVEQTPSI